MLRKGHPSEKAPDLTPFLSRSTFSNTEEGDSTMRKIIEYTLVSADGVIGDAQN